MSYFVHESSYVDDDVIIGEETKIWHFCHIQKGARIGKKCSFGQNVNISNNVIIGDPESYFAILNEVHGTPFCAHSVQATQLDLAQKLINAR